MIETTALGAAYLAGLGRRALALADARRRAGGSTGASSRDGPRDARDAAYEGWRRAVERARAWVEPDDGGVAP